MTLLPLMDLRKSAGVLEPVPAAGAAGAGAAAASLIERKTETSSESLRKEMKKTLSSPFDLSRKTKNKTKQKLQVARQPHNNQNFSLLSLLLSAIAATSRAR